MQINVANGTLLCIVKLKGGGGVCVCLCVGGWGGVGGGWSYVYVCRIVYNIPTAQIR